MRNITTSKELKTPAELGASILEKEAFATMSSRHDIPPAEVEAELARLWSSNDTAHATRACLFNLVIYTQDPARSAYFQDTVKMVIEKFPCRIIMIQVEPEAASSYLKMGVSTESVGQGKDTITCERISIDASADRLHQVPFVLLPHLLPDLPVYLIWGQDPCQDNEVLPHLSRFAKRVIFDSDSSENLHSFADNILELIGCGSYDLVDINWARLTGWRRVLAQVFDCQERIDQLKHAERIVITYNGAEHDLCKHRSLQARYFQAWLAGQMGWTFQEASRTNDGILISYKQVQILLRPEESAAAAPGAIQEVDISSPGSVSYSLERHQGERMVKVHAHSADSCELPLSVPLSIQEKGMQFLTEIFYEPPSRHYRTMLKAMAQQTKVCP